VLSFSSCISHLFLIFHVVKRILHYVKGTLWFGLSFTPSSSRELIAYSNSDWVECPYTRRSVFGYAVYLCGDLISWSFKKQPTVLDPVVNLNVRHWPLLPPRLSGYNIFFEIFMSFPSLSVMLCDNQSSIFLVVNLVSHKRSKHVDLDYHFVIELVASGELKIRFIPTY
jgi:hypothetical protein